MRTTYSDGTTVFVNFGRQAASLDGVSVPGRSFQVKPGNPNHKPISMVEDVMLNNLPPAPVPDGNRCTGEPLRGAADVAARLDEFTVSERRRPNPVTG